MSLKLLPGIVWALDEDALNLVRQWWKRLPSEAQRVFTVADSWEKFTQILSTYREQRFDEVLLQAGLSLELQEQGRRVNVVTIASFPAESQISWAEAEAKLSTLSAHVSLEHHRVLLRPSLPAIDDPEQQEPPDASQLSPLRVLPWLLTRVVTGGFTLSEEEFFQHVSSLLDVLLLTEREGGQAPAPIVNAFFAAPQHSGHVHLAGFSRLSLEKLLDEMAASLSHAILHRAYNRPYEDIRPAIQAFEHRLAELIGEFLRGERTATQVEDHLFTPQGLPRLEVVAAILREVPELLDRQALRLQREETAAPPPPSRLARVWQRILAWLCRPQPQVRREPDQVQREYLIGRLRQLSHNIQEAARHAREGQEGLELPSEFKSIWSDELKSLVMKGIKRQWQAQELTHRLAMKITRDIQQNFSQAISNWGLQIKQVQEVARALEVGNLLRFNALLQGGLPVIPQAVVTSFNLGPSLRHDARNVPCATLKVYPGRPPYLVAASEPVPIEHIKF